MDNFYVTLPSNVRSEYFENTLTKFTTKLANRIKLSDEWEVGLTSISYTKSWKIKSEIVSLYIRYYAEHNKHWLPQNVTLDLNDFKTIEELISEINSKLKNIEDTIGFELPRLSINETTHRVEITLTVNKQFENALVYPVFTYNLAAILGFNKDKMDDIWKSKYKQYYDDYMGLPRKERYAQFLTWRPSPPEESEKLIIAEEPYSFTQDLKSLYVYCDIIKHSFVGNSLEQLLRIVNVPPKSKFKDQIVFNYSDVHYVPLLLKEFENITIDIRDQDNDPIQFTIGRTIITLHFRKKNE